MEERERRILPKYRGEGAACLETSSSYQVKELYSPDDLNGFDYYQDLNHPGEYPYTRGIHRNMYRERFWSKRFFVGLPTPKESNQRFKELIQSGQTGIIIVPDNPGHMGLDPDHPRTLAHNGVTGTPMYSLECMEELFAGIPLEDIAVDLRGDPSVAAVSELAQFVAFAENAGFDIKKLRGSLISNTIHCQFAMNWDICNPLDLGIKLCVDGIEFCTQNMPLWHPLCIAGYDMRELGINAVQELAFSFAEALIYIRAALSRGLEIDQFAPRIVFSFGANIDFFEEIAKIRAARRIWAQILKEELGAKDPRAWKLKVSMKTSGSSLTTQQPINNIIRTTLEALAAVLAGCQSMEPCGYDEAIAEPAEEAATVALNIQHILSYESGVVNTPDPLGGSYYLESLTKQIEEEAKELLQKIEELGGMRAATEKGWCRQEVQRAYVERLRETNTKKRIVVGVNDFVVPKEKEIPLPLKPYRKKDQEIFQEKIQTQAKNLRARRDNERVRNALDALRRAADKGERENLVRPMVNAYKAYATMAEILGTIRMTYGYDYDPFGCLQYPFT